MPTASTISRISVGNASLVGAWSDRYSSITPRRIRLSGSDCVVTVMPAATGVVQEAG